MPQGIFQNLDTCIIEDTQVLVLKYTRGLVQVIGRLKAHLGGAGGAALRKIFLFFSIFWVSFHLISSNILINI